MELRDAGYETIMINCNPETVSTDYDTSDRLYFEPLTLEDVLEVVYAEQASGTVAGVICTLGGQTPLGLAQPLKDAGVPVLGTQPEAIDLAEHRGAFGRVLAEAGLPAPKHGIAVSFNEAKSVADEIGYPVLVRPSYVLGGRAMRICYSGEQMQDAMCGIEGRVLVDRFLEDAVEIDVDALSDGTLCYVAAVMQHVEEAGVHSGDSACALPAPSLDPTTYFEVCHVVRRLARALGVVGLLNVQLALAGGDLYVLEANPRASRTVPFASKATGINLVEAACKLAAGARISELGLPPERPPAQVSVKAAVLPFARFPGADPVLGPEMRSTGEVMASARDFPTAFAKAERAAGRPLPTHGTAFLSVRDADKNALVPVAAALAGLGFELVATAGTADALRSAGLDVDEIEKGKPVVDMIRKRRFDLVVNTPEGGNARSDGYAIREAALATRIPCITTSSGAAMAVHAIASARREDALSLQERIAVEAVGV
jgi:carbamoyl-phosphate synthase large subunit